MVKLLREQLETEATVQEEHQVVAVLEDQEPEPYARDGSDDPLDPSLPEEYPHDAARTEAQGLEQSDLPRLLNRHGDERVGNAEGGDHGDEDQQKEHHVFLDAQRGEKLAVLLDPVSTSNSDPIAC